MIYRWRSYRIKLPLNSYYLANISDQYSEQYELYHLLHFELLEKQYSNLQKKKKKKTLVTEKNMHKVNDSVYSSTWQNLIKATDHCKVINAKPGLLWIMHENNRSR